MRGGWRGEVQVATAFSPYGIVLSTQCEINLERWSRNPSSHPRWGQMKSPVKRQQVHNAVWKINSNKGKKDAYLLPPQHLQISRNGRQPDTTNGSLWEKSTLLSLLEFLSSSWLSRISDAILGILLGPFPQQPGPRQSTDQYWHPV